METQYVTNNWRDRDVLYIRKLEEWLKRTKKINVDISLIKKDRLVASVVVWMKNMNISNFKVVCRIIKYSGHPLLYLYYAIKTIIVKNYYWHILKKDQKVCYK